MSGRKNEVLRAIGHAPLSSTTPGPALHSRAFAQRRLPGCASFGFGLGRACALLCLVQPPRRLHGRRLPARQGFCGRRERGQLGYLAPAPLTRRSSLQSAYYLQPCHIWIKSVCCLHYLTCHLQSFSWVCIAFGSRGHGLCLFCCICVVLCHLRGL